MSEYEIVSLILDLEKTSVEYGQFIMAGMFGFVIVSFLFGQKMPRPLIIILSVVYSLYVTFLNVGVFACYWRISHLAGMANANWYGRLFGDPGSSILAGAGVAGFWVVAYFASIAFLILVRRGGFEPQG